MAKDYIYITNDIIHKKIKIGDEIPDGWRRGYEKSRPTGNSNPKIKELFTKDYLTEMLNKYYVDEIAEIHNCSCSVVKKICILV